jgi:hypothetical protein
MISHPQEMHERIVGPPIGGESLWPKRPTGQPAGAAIRGHRLSLGGAAPQHHPPRILRLCQRSRGQVWHIVRPPTTLATVVPVPLQSAHLGTPG